MGKIHKSTECLGFLEGGFNEEFLPREAFPEMLSALHHKYLHMSTRLNLMSPQKQCQWNSFKKKKKQTVPGYHNNPGSNIMLTNCKVI